MKTIRKYHLNLLTFLDIVRKICCLLAKAAQDDRLHYRLSPTTHGLPRSRSRVFGYRRRRSRVEWEQRNRQSGYPDCGGVILPHYGCLGILRAHAIR